MQERSQGSPGEQQGVALIVCMITLMVLTFIGMSSTRISKLEVLMGTNTQDSVTSFMIAEDSVFAGEQRVATVFNGPPTMNLSANTQDGLYMDVDIEIDTLDWAGIPYESEPRVGEPPREYIIEYIGPRTVPTGSLGAGTGVVGNQRFIYRVSGHGGSNRGSARVVQTIFSML
ncbi:MAG: PilX N-terminal domain-containing pilus assembly protein [Gammaproteobacteria bacterium]